MEKIIALLPMKGHSERVPNKNLKDFQGKPLFHMVLKSLIESKYIERVVINTDSKEIGKNAVENFGKKVLVIDRPVNIQGDFVSMNAIIEYDIQNLEKYTHFIQTHSTNPLLKSKTIDTAVEKYFDVISNKDFDSLFSVTRFQTRFYWDTGKAVNHNPNELIRTQDLPIMYEENSNFYIFSKESFQANDNKRIGENPFLFEMDKIESIDIDDKNDFLIAEGLYNLL